MLRTLDTNICSYILRRHPAGMIERFTNLSRDDLWLSAIVAAELRFGAAKLGAPRFKAAVRRGWPVLTYDRGPSTRPTITQIFEPGWNVRANPSAAWI